MKKILIIHSNMEIGGAETSLLGLLYAFDYTQVEVDLFLMNPVGDMLPLLPKSVRLLQANAKYRALVIPIKEAVLQGHFGIALARVTAKLVCAVQNTRKRFSDYGYIVKQRSHLYTMPFLPMIKKNYDLAISFNDPHYIVGKKVSASKKIGWFHTDFSKITPCGLHEESMWGKCDHIVNVSSSCKEQFDIVHPDFETKSIVIENILPRPFVEYRSKQFLALEEMPDEGAIKLLSIGRFSYQKNFDNVPAICARLREMGLDVTWYLIGFGGDEALICQKIREAGMEEHVIVLGKRENPYPYIRACDLYVQPSRYEGKAVTVREAQMLGKPVVITDYPTSASQLEDGVDGVIVPMDTEGCARGIAQLLRDPARMARLAENCRQRDYSNAAEVEKLYRLMEG